MAGSRRTPRLSSEIRAAPARVIMDARAGANLAFSRPSPGDVSEVTKSAEPAITHRTPRVVRLLLNAVRIVDFL